MHVYIVTGATVKRCPCSAGSHVGMHLGSYQLLQFAPGHWVDPGLCSPAGFRLVGRSSSRATDSCRLISRLMHSLQCMLPRAPVAACHHRLYTPSDSQSQSTASKDMRSTCHAGHVHARCACKGCSSICLLQLACGMEIITNVRPSMLSYLAALWLHARTDADAQG
jgi:hypothetical protein